MDKRYEKQLQKQRMRLLDLDKLREQNKAGLSIREMSIVFDIPYATLYRAIKGRDEDKPDGQQ